MGVAILHKLNAEILLIVQEYRSKRQKMVVFIVKPIDKILGKCYSVNTRIYGVVKTLLYDSMKDR